MKIEVIAVGKLKEDYLKKGILEYSKRLKSYCDLKIIEVADEKAPENLSKAELEKVKDSEGKRILEKLNRESFIITLEIEGKSLSSEEFAEKISSITLEGNSEITFIIGGSNGLSENVTKISDFSFSFSKLTFPHQLMRLILIEQIYRAFRIINNHPYHK